MKEYFTAEPVNAHVTCIRSGSNELMYLLQGTDRALLMDTTVGIYGLRGTVDSLTKLPYDVILTHGHIDHAMGAPEFKDKTIYMNLKDIPVYKSMQAIEGRMGYAEMSTQGRFQLTAEDFVAPEDLDFTDVTDGMTFDLGGLHVEVLCVPGHTQGSIALLLQEERTLILGDAGNPFTFLFDEQFSSTVTDYRKMLLDLEKRVEGKIDCIYLCHGTMEVPTYLIPELIETCDDILAGNTDDVPFEFMGNTGAFIAKKMDFDENGPHRADGKLANIIYNKNRL